MSTYLLTWNPNKWEWDDLDDIIAEVRTGVGTESTWSCGSVREIPEGSRFFLIRLGREPRGIVGSGTILHGPYEEEHWDEARRAQGDTARFIDIRFDQLSRLPPIRRTELDHTPFGEFTWDSQMSGVRVPDEIAAELEKLWHTRVSAEDRGIAHLNPATVAHWKALWADCQRDSERLERYGIIDERRRAVRPQMQAVLSDVLSDKLSREEFRNIYQHRIANEWDVFGLKGMSGAMFLNKLTKHLPDEEEVIEQLAATLPAPADIPEARAKLTAFRSYLDDQISKGVARKKEVAPAYSTFFVTSWWHIQNPEEWPIFYVSARRALNREGLVGRRLRGPDGYLEFRRVFAALQGALGASSWELEHLLAWLDAQAVEDGDEVIDDNDDEEAKTERVWLIAPGSGASRWEEYYADGIMGIGWDFLGDLSQYSDRDSIQAAISEHMGGGARSNDALCCYQFVKEMQVGDQVFVKRGRKEIIGYGVITSEYKYEPARGDQPNIRTVDWKKKGAWVPREKSLVTKTLTEIGKYPGLVAQIRKALDLDEAATGESHPTSRPVYNLDQAIRDIFIPRGQIEEALELLKYKKNVILQGPPGVGKTFFAKRLAYLLLGEKDPERIEQVQFHQSYAYEDFVQGYRPQDDGKFGRSDGPFLRFCDQALQDPDSPYVFIIDEINRGNLSKIFGELLLLIEADKRSQIWSTALTYSKDDDERFYIPPNLHIIGTMNTADRSLAMVDYALRRRFAFVDLKPGFETKGFSQKLSQLEAEPSLKTQIMERFARLNRDIARSPELGEGFCIGHSYFCRKGEGQEAGEAWYNRIVRTEIQPLLREYWFDNHEKADEQVALLLDDD